MDDKTKQEREVMDALKASKGFTTIFWITSNQRRARVVDRLEKRGNLVRIGNHSYPVIRFKVLEVTEVEKKVSRAIKKVVLKEIKKRKENKQ